jgi:hypothetical protein
VSEIGVVHRFRTIGAAIDHLVSRLSQAEPEPFLEWISAVIGSDGNDGEAFGGWRRFDCVTRNEALNDAGD